jgi:hydroxymethylbilane synthase
MNSPLILGTRGSDLALAQAHMTEAALRSHDIDVRIEVVRTIGDKRPDLKLAEFSQGENPVVDKGIFTKELEEALLRSEIDFAVHSLKDVPTDLADGFEICATLPRAEIPDIVLSKTGEIDLTSATVATSSVRRARQLDWLYPGVAVEGIRGNVPTRIRKLVENDSWDAILLARAGLERLGIYEPGNPSFDFEGTTVFATELAPETFLPAAGQGAVAMEIRSDNEEARAALARINHEPTFQRVRAERAFLARLKAGCQTPVGAHTWFEDGGSTLAMSVRVFNENDPAASPHERVARAEVDEVETLVDALLNGYEAPGGA